MALTLTAPGIAPTDPLSIQPAPDLTVDPVDFFGMDAPDYRDDYEKQMDTWRMESATALDKAVIDPVSYTDERIPGGWTPDEWRKTRIVDDWMRLHSDGEEPPLGPAREFTRAMLAERHFGGEGKDSDDALFSKITETATKRRDVKIKDAAIIAAAQDDYLLPPGSSPGFRAVREGIKTLPGYDKATDADDYELFTRSRAGWAEQLEPIREPLNAAWDAAIAGKGIPRQALLGVPDEMWIPFLNAFRLRAQTLPDTERETFLAGAMKDFNRTLEGFGRNAADALTEVGLAQPTDPMVGLADAIYGTDQYSESEAGRKAAAQDFNQGRNRAHEVRRIINAEYDPIDYVENLGWLQKAPGVTVTSLSMAVPVVGQATMAASMMGAAQEKVYLRMRDSGMSEADAGQVSSALAPVIMLPQMALEKIGYGAWGRKLPWMGKIIDGVGDRIANRVARFFVKGGVITGIEGTTEVLQEFTDFAVQDLAHEFAPHVPDVDLGKEFQGAWRQFPEIAGSMVFLSLYGAAGGLNAEARAAAWAQATPRQMAAVGITPEGIQRIEEAKAKGPSSLLTTVTDEWSTRDPNSPEAAAASKEEAQAVANARRAHAALADGIGYSMPSITARPDGTFVVRDNMTGEEIGKAADLNELDQVVRAHSVAMESMQEDEMLQLVTWLKAAGVAAKDSGIEQELNLSRRFGMADVEAMGPEATERYLAEVALQEQAEGGDGSAARAVFGYNVTETRNGLKQTVNRIFQGANLGTLFHENWHAARRKAKAAGALTREDDIRLLRAFDRVLKGKTREVKNADGSTLVPATRKSFIPDGMADADITEELLDEAIAEIAEVMTFLFPRGHKTNQHGLTRKLVSSYLGTVGRLAPEATRKFSAFIRAIRAKMGLAMARAYDTKRAMAKGEFDQAELDSYLSKLLGTDQQQEHDDGVRAELNRILNMPENPADDEIPFSLGRAVQVARAELNQKRAARNEISIKWELDTQRLADEGETFYYPEIKLPEDDQYLDEFLPLDAIQQADDGKWYFSDKPTDYDTLQEAQESAFKIIRDKLKEIAPRSIFGSDNDARDAAGGIFDAFPYHPAITDQWTSSKWGSWYLQFRDETDTIRKISVRDHGATRGDMGLPDRSFYVSKQWNPEEVGKALESALEYIEENSPTRAAEVADDDIPFSVGRLEDVEIIPQVDGPVPTVAGPSFSIGLAAVHNLTSENLKFADEMGGLAVPSIAVVPVGNVVDGFGEITLLGGRPLADPAMNPVFDADAYTTRFPSPEWKKVSMKVAQSVVDKFRPFSKKGLDRGWNLIDAIWDNAVNKPDPEKAISQLKRIPSAKAAYLSLVHGVEIEPVMQPAKIEVTGVNHPIFRKWIKDSGGVMPRYDDTAGRQKMTDALLAAEEAVLKERYATVNAKDRKFLLDKARKTSLENLDNGLLPYNFEHRLTRSIEKLDTQELDQDATNKIIDEALAGLEAEFYSWIETMIRGMFDAPRIKVGGKFEPYTIENIVRVMTAGRIAGSEKTMTFSEGQIRAMNAHRFHGLEEMRNYAEGFIKTEEEVKAIREELSARLSKWREDVMPFYKWKSAWDALDNSMEALGRFLKGPRNPARMAASMRGMDFEGVPQRLIEEAIEIGQAFMKAPVPYFESKPQRVVRLNEFSGAVVPEGTEQETIAILEKHGITVETVKGEQSRDTTARMEAISKLAEKTQISFSIGRSTVAPTADTRTFQGTNGETVIGPASFAIGAWHGTPHKVDKFSTEKIGTGEGAQAYGWGLYFAESNQVAEQYRTGTKTHIPDGDMMTYATIRAHRSEAEADAQFLKISPAADLKAVKKQFQQYAGNLYRVNLKVDDEDLLDWDKPLSGQSEKVAAALEDLGLVDRQSKIRIGDGAMWYRDAGEPQEAARRLLKRGIRGIRYLDGNSRSNQFSVRGAGDYHSVINSTNGQKTAEFEGRDSYEKATAKAAELNGQGSYNYVIFDEADIEILEENGTPVNKDEGPSFSIGRADVAERMQAGALSLVRDPVRRVQAMSRVARDFGDLFLSFQRIEALAGRRRSKAQLRQEANAREDLAAEEKIGAVWAKYGGVMADDDLTRLKAQPVFNYLSVPRPDGRPDPLRGRLMSKAQAIKKHPERYALHKAGEYDGSDGISRTVFGGTLMPDQAAQELFDAGLIAEPTPDAMWAALASEQKTVATMQDFLKQAMEEIREAKREAKREASEWLETQGKEQESNYNPKEEILASLRMLDAILLALPPEIRGKIGGYTQMARITTDDARLKFLKDKLKKADKELETFLREAFTKEWLDLLDRAKPDKDNPGQRPIGVIDADSLDILRKAEAAMWLSFSEGEAEADKLDALAEHEDTKPYDAEKLRATAQMVRLTANWSAADAARREQAVIEGTRIYYGGLAALRVKNSARAARLRELQDSAKRGTAKAGDRMDRKKIQRKEKETRAGQASRLVWEFLSFGQLVNVLFGEKSAAAKWFNSREIAASNAYEDGVQAKADAMESMLETLAGSRFGGEKLRHRMQTEERITTVDALGKTHTFTDSEAITFLLMWRQEDGRRHMEGQMDDDGNLISEWGWTEQNAEEIEKALSTEARAMMAFIGSSYGEEYGRVNDVFRRIWNVSMPRHKMYAPLTVKPSMGRQDAIVDPVSGDSMGVGMTPGSLKNRSQTATAEPDFRDAFQVYLTHARQMEHFIAYAEFSRDAMAVVNRREIRNSIDAVSPTGAAALGKWIDYFALGGLREAAAGGGWQQFFSGALSRLSQAALVGRVSVLAMQTLQLGAAAYKMPLGAFLSRFARLQMGRLSWGEAIKSDYIQRRMKEMPPAVRDAIAGLSAGTPNRSKFMAAKAARSIPGADGLFTAGTYAILYDYHLTQARKAGMPDPEKHAHAEAERITDQVAQPVRTGARSWLEVSQQNQPAFRALWNFSTDPRQKMALIVYEAMRHDVSGKEKAAAVGKAVAVTWAVSGILQAVVRAVLRDMRSDDDDEVFDERHWDLKKLGLMAFTGPFGGLPYIGKMIEGSVYAWAGEYHAETELLTAVPKAGTATKRLATGDSDDVLKDIESVLNGGAAVSGTSGALTSAMHVIRDAVNIYENLDGD